MTLPEQLAAAALIGTAQQPFTLPAPAAAPTDRPALDASLARLPRTANSAELLLSAAALITCYRAAGAEAALGQDVPTAPPAEEDARPLATGLAAAHLATILTSRRPLVAEWLALLSESGRRPAPELIPSLLDAAASDAALRAAAAKAAGPLGVWLAAFRPGWSWLSASGDGDVWETGSLAGRLAALRAVRAADPARARAMIEEVWSTENADVRRQMTEALANALSMEDEPFLEAALDDRSAQVRAAAAEYLSQLSGSRLVERMRDRVRACVTLKKEGLFGRKLVLDVDLLDAPDAAAQRDGLDKKPPASPQLGARGWWTLTALSTLPPKEWTIRFALEPAQLIEAASNGQWQALLMSAWATAAGRYKDAAWLNALIPHMPNPLLFVPLAPAERERLALSCLASNKDFLSTVPACCPHPWSLAFTERFAAAARNHLAGGAADYRIGAVLQHAALHASTAAPLPFDADQIPLLAAFVDTLAFRRQMKRALFEPQE